MDLMSCTRINETFENSFTTEPEALRITRTIVFSLIAALALVGNYVVCRAVWRNPGPKPIAHYFVSNLAFAEIVSMVCLIFTFHAYEPPWSWKLGHVMCKILEPLQIASLLVVTTTLALLAVYRCVLLIKPMVRKPTRRQTCCVILVSWVGAVGLSVPTGHFRVVNSYGEKCEIHHCEELFPEGYKHYQNIYSVVLFVINFALPLVIMTISYVVVSKKIRQHVLVVQRLRDQEGNTFKSSLVLPSTGGKEQIGVMSQMAHAKHEIIELSKIVKNGITEMKEGEPQRTKWHLKQNDVRSGIGENLHHDQTTPSTEYNQQNKDTFELENDILKMVYALVLIFVLCYIPYQVQFLLREFNVEAFVFWPHRQIVARVSFTLTCVPSALHPVFYGLMSKFYRKSFIRIFSCR